MRAEQGRVVLSCRPLLSRDEDALNASIQVSPTKQVHLLNACKRVAFAADTSAGTGVALQGVDTH